MLQIGGIHEKRLAAVMVVTDIDRHPVQPELGVAFNTVEVLQQSEKYLLARILSVFQTPEQPVCRPKNPLLVLGMEQFKPVPGQISFADRKCKLSRAHFVQPLCVSGEIFVEAIF